MEGILMTDEGVKASHDSSVDEFLDVAARLRFVIHCLQEVGADLCVSDGGSRQSLSFPYECIKAGHNTVEKLRVANKTPKCLVGATNPAICIGEEPCAAVSRL
jgi:hypothetical protein